MDGENRLVKNEDMGIQDDNAPEKVLTDSQLQREVDELDDALDKLAADRKALQERQLSLGKQIEKLKKDIKKHKRKLSGRNVLSVGTAFLRIIITVLLCVGLIYSIQSSITIAESNLSAGKDEILLNHYAKISVINESINDLTQQRNKLLKELIASRSDRLSVASTVLTEQNREELDDYVASLRRYPTKRLEQKRYEGVSYYQVAHRYDMDGYLLSDAGNSSVYPGAVLRGDSLMQGTTNYALIAQNRKPMTLTCSRGGNSIRLEDGSYGAVTHAVEQLWTESNPEYSQKWEYSVHSTQNEEELKLNLGISAGVGSASLGVSHTDKTSTMAINFTETYFSIVAEPQTGATQYFQDGYDLKSLGDYEPAYVSSVDYGRRLVVLVTTELSEDELNAKLGANIRGVDIGAAIEYIKKNIDSNYRMCVYGGDSAKSLQLIDSNESGGIKGWWDKILTGKSDVIDDVGNAIAEDDSLINPVPLAYHLKYLSDNSAVPAAAILNEDIILAENAKLVTITLEGGDKAVPGVFRLDNSVGTIGYVLDKDWIRIAKKGETSGEIQFIWDSSRSASLIGYFNDKLVTFSLKELPTEADNIFELASKGSLFSTTKTDIHIYISDAVYEIN